MLLKRLILLGLVTGLLVLNGSSAYSQSFPTRTIRIVASEVGGGADTLARLITPALSESLGQAVIVDNRGGILMPQVAASAAPDGYTLLLANSGTWLAEYLRTDLPYKNADFAPVSWVSSSPGILVVHPSVSANSVKELIALAKAKPGELNYASGPVGAANYLSAELFNYMAGVQLVRVGYKGGAPAMSDLMGGQVQVMFATVGSVIQHVKSNRLVALGVTGAEPTVLAPGVPTIAASGLPGYELIAIYGLFAPAKTPPAIIASLNQATRQVLEQADVKEKLFTAGMEAGGGTPKDFDVAVKSDVARIARIVKKP